MPAEAAMILSHQVEIATDQVQSGNLVKVAVRVLWRTVPMLTQIAIMNLKIKMDHQVQAQCQMIMIQKTTPTGSNLQVRRAFKRSKPPKGHLSFLSPQLRLSRPNRLKIIVIQINRL
jgi:hypothetical protein